MVIPLYDRNPTRRVPWVTLALIAANIVVFVLVQPTLREVRETFRIVGPADETEMTDQEFFVRWAHIPCEVTTGEPVSERDLVTGECTREGGGGREFFGDKNVWLAVAVSMFLHGSLLHLLFNVWFLWIFGNNVEDFLGPARYVLLYVLGGLAAAAVQQASDLGSLVPVIGASGAVAAVMGAYLVQFPRARIWTLVTVIPLPLPAWLMLGLWFVLQFTIPMGSGIAILAHIGGFVAGILLMLLLRTGRTETPRAGYSEWSVPDAGR